MQQGTVRAIEAGGWAVGVSVLEYVTTSTEVERWLQQLVPHPLVPLVAIVLGGAALAVRVYRHGTAASAPALSLDAPAPAEPQTVQPTPGLALASAASAVTPPAAPYAAPEAADVAPPQLPELRDPAAAAAWTGSVGTPAESSWPAAVEPTNGPEPSAPPTSFIPLPTR